MARLTDHELDDIKARNPLADVAGGYVKLRRAGARMVGPCPICGGRAGSQRFEVLPDGESWVCAVCQDGGDVIRLVERVEGCDFRAAIERLGGRAAIDPDQAQRVFEAREKKRLAREAENQRYRDKERARLWEMWDSAADLHGSLAAAYLEGRGLSLPARCPGIRFLAAAPYWHGNEIDANGRSAPRALHTGPAMVAAFIRADGHFGGLHLTWLDAGAGAAPTKLQLHDPETGELLNSKKMRGSKAGAHIAFVRPTAPPRRLFVGEGIETVGSVWTALTRAGRPLDDAAFWAAGDLGNLAGRARETLPHPELLQPSGRPQRVPGPQPDPDDPGLAIPDSVEELILLGDGDSEAVLTRWAMTRAARRYARPGRVIRIAMAAQGQDFNTMLRSAA